MDDPVLAMDNSRFRIGRSGTNHSERIMKNVILLVGLAVVSATVYGLNHRIGGCAEPPNPPGNHVTEHNKTVLATRFDVEIASATGRTD